MYSTHSLACYLFRGAGEGRGVHQQVLLVKNSFHKSLQVTGHHNKPTVNTQCVYKVLGLLLELITIMPKIVWCEVTSAGAKQF
jgi:hypothetical protein